MYGRSRHSEAAVENKYRAFPGLGDGRHGEGVRGLGGSGALNNIRKAGLCLVALAASAPVLLREAHADSARICDLSVQYDMAPTSAEVSADLRAFAGVWQGGGGLPGTETCFGLVVYSFQPGRFHSRFIWNANAGRGINNRASHGNIPRMFEFKNGVARFNGAEVQFELQVVNPNELTGYRIDAQGRLPVWFKRK